MEDCASFVQLYVHGGSGTRRRTRELLTRARTATCLLAKFHQKDIATLELEYLEDENNFFETYVLPYRQQVYEPFWSFVNSMDLDDDDGDDSISEKCPNIHVVDESKVTCLS
jgi:hypothetical protein